jgi:hypothetical protein
VKSLLYYDRMELITLNLFWIGFIMYSAAWTASQSYRISPGLCALVQVIGMLLFIPACLRLIQFKFGNEYQKILFILFFTWAITILIRGFSLEEEELRGILFAPWFGGFLYLVPVIMLFPQKLIYYKKIFDTIIILGVFYILCDFISFSDLMNPDMNDVRSQAMVEYYSKNLAVPVIFLLLTYPYHSKNRLLFAAAVLLLTIFFAIVRARRGLLFMAIGPIFFIYLLYWFNSKRKLLMMILSWSIVVALAAGLIYYLNTTETNIFDGLEERATEDTRSGVEKYFFMDMKGWDWVIGRGMSGEYYSLTMGVGNHRGTLETDYLNMILKGGLINLVLLLMILIPAIVNGIFRSKNTLSKGAGLWILIWLLNTYPSTVQVFSLYYMLVWISVGICYSKTIRNIPENFLIAYFKTPRS